MVSVAKDEWVRSGMQISNTLIPPCTNDLCEVHYTFDFAQSLTVPHHARQEGQLYFVTPRKVQLFGVCIEGAASQVNYLIDEDCAIGKDGTNTHGPNTVLTLLHHALTMYGVGEMTCNLHCDNCFGMYFEAVNIVLPRYQVISILKKLIKSISALLKKKARNANRLHLFGRNHLIIRERQEAFTPPPPKKVNDNNKEEVSLIYRPATKKHQTCYHLLQ